MRKEKSEAEKIQEAKECCEKFNKNPAGPLFLSVIYIIVIAIFIMFNTLREVNYTGVCSLEYAKDMSDVLPGVAESIGYFNGVLKCNA